MLLSDVLSKFNELYADNADLDNKNVSKEDVSRKDYPFDNVHNVKDNNNFKYNLDNSPNAIIENTDKYDYDGPSYENNSVSNQYDYEGPSSEDNPKINQYDYDGNPTKKDNITKSFVDYNNNETVKEDSDAINYDYDTDTGLDKTGKIKSMNYDNEVESVNENPFTPYSINNSESVINDVTKTVTIEHDNVIDSDNNSTVKYDHNTTIGTTEPFLIAKQDNPVIKFDNTSFEQDNTKAVREREVLNITKSTEPTFERYLNNFEQDNTQIARENFEKQLDLDAKVIADNVWDRLSDQQSWLSKEDFMDNLSNAVSNELDTLNQIAASEASQLLNIKNQFVNSLMNFVGNSLQDVTSVGQAELRKLKEKIEWGSYLAYRNLADNKIDSSTLSGKALNKLIGKIEGADKIIGLANSVGKPRDFYQENKDWHETATNNKSSVQFSTIFKGYESIQEAYASGFAVDYYWDITIGYYKTDNNYGRPDLPFKGKWFPVKSFDFDDDYLDAEDIKTGNMTLRILKDRTFPKQITLTVLDDYHRRIERFFREYNDSVCSIGKSNAYVLPYDYQAFKINISFMKPTYELWRKISYIAIPEIRIRNTGTETKEKRSEYAIKFNIIGIADIDKMFENSTSRPVANKDNLSWTQL